jgi:hypothetical protein
MLIEDLAFLFILPRQMADLMKEYYYEEKELKKKKREFSFSSKMKGTDN